MLPCGSQSFIMCMSQLSKDGSQAMPYKNSLRCLARGSLNSLRDLCLVFTSNGRISFIGIILFMNTSGAPVTTLRIVLSYNNLQRDSTIECGLQEDFVGL